MSFIDKIFARINGTADTSSTASSGSTSPDSVECRFTTAIDKRAFMVNSFIKEFRNSTGTDSRLMENLLIQVVKNEDDDDMARYDWIGKRFEDDLKRELANAFLDNIGRESLEIVLCPKSDTTESIALIDNYVYYKWIKHPADTEIGSQSILYERGLASISIIDDTGSLANEHYILDSDKKNVFHIGRGSSSRKGGKFRVNDIIIKENEADPDLMECNSHVSSAHADIIYKNNRFYLKASHGGCRATGGSPTKLVRNEIASELRDMSLMYPLEDGDIIELGKKLLLIFSIITEVHSDSPGTTKTSRALDIDDSF